METVVAHTTVATVCNELAKISDKVSPKEFTFILATSIRPMIQLNMPAACLNPVAVPLVPQPKPPSQQEKATYIKEAKTATLPNKDHTKLAQLPHNGPTHPHPPSRCDVPQETNWTPCAELATNFKIIHWHAQKCVTGCFYPSGGHTSKKNKTDTATTTMSTDSAKNTVTSIPNVSSKTPLNPTQSQPWQSSPVTKTEPTDSHTVAVPTSGENLLYIPGSESDEINLEVTMEDEDIDAFQDRMATIRHNTTENETTDDSDQNTQHPPLVEARVFVMKPPTSKRPKQH